MSLSDDKLTQEVHMFVELMAKADQLKNLKFRNPQPEEKRLVFECFTIIERSVLETPVLHCYIHIIIS